MIIDSAQNDLDIINNLGNQVGGNVYAAEVLNPVFASMNIHYAVKNVHENISDGTSRDSKEFIVFNPKDINILKMQNLSAKKDSLDQELTNRVQKQLEVFIKNNHFIKRPPVNISKNIFHD